MPGRSFSTPIYRYGFNGKEKDNEAKGTGAQYDYGFRIYDPRLGKFLSVDPLFQSYPWLSTYQFAENCPIQFVDIDGRESGWIDNGMGCQYMGSGDIGNVYRRPLDIDIKPQPKPQVVHEQSFKQGGISGTEESKIYAENLKVAYEVSKFAPVTGDIHDAKDVGVNLSQGNYKSALFSSLFLIPGADAFKGLKFFKFAEKVHVTGFVSDALLKSHFEKHAAEFGSAFKNADEYLKGAQDFFKSESKDIIQYTRKNGDIVRYDAANNIFGTATKDGNIRTMFKPDKGLDYFKKGAESDLGAEGAEELNKLVTK